MSLYGDIQAAQAVVDQDKAKLAQDQAALDSLLSQQMKGGPDVSQFQGDVDWAKVATVSDTTFVRVADGDVRDSYYSNARVDAIRSAGLNFSPYYFGRVASDSNNQRNGKSEAAMAIYFAESKGWGKAGDLPLAYDFEDLNGQTAAKAGKHLMEFVRTYKYVKGHWPIVYTSPGFVSPVVATLDDTAKQALSSCPLWVAHWGVASPTVPSPWTDWTFWQYTDKGTCPGVTGSVDLNRVGITNTAYAALRL